MLDIREKYFNWLCDLVYSSKRINQWSYHKLFRTLDSVEFFYIHPLDENRQADGINFRYRFGYEFGYSYSDIDEAFEDKPCSVLEMMVALAFRCEEDIMSNSAYGDRTSQWFWVMISSLGLGGMTDKDFDHEYVCDILEKFLTKQYTAEGAGGLFYIPEFDRDMRDLDIWYQMNAYLIYIDDDEDGDW